MTDIKLKKIEKPIEEKHEFCVGDVVTNKFSSEGIILGITKGTDGETWASVYSQSYSVPQLVRAYNLKFTGKHIDITKIFDGLSDKSEDSE